jgi:hypothetical protein
MSPHDHTPRSSASLAEESATALAWSEKYGIAYDTSQSIGMATRSLSLLTGVAK